jgi:simple sugar transport system ATP-binding protein
VFDEPTAVLTESEAEQLLRTIRTLAEKGIAVLFISHRLDEVLSIADRVTVLRDGEVVRSLLRADTTVELLAELMIGKALAPDARIEPRPAPETETVLEVEELEVSMPGEETRGIDLDIRRGEIFGIGGLAGQGKLGIANGIVGLHPAAGRVRFEGSPLPLEDPRGALERGVVFVSEDRRGVGLLMDQSVEANVALTAVHIQGKFLKGKGPLALFDTAAARAHTLRNIADLDIRCRGPEQAVRRLSGGNQQKVCLARAFTLEPRLLFVSEPTRGVDVGAKDRVLRLLVALNREHGITVVLTSSELAELRRVSDRIAIIDKGRVAGILPPDAPEVEFGLLMGGERR